MPTFWRKFKSPLTRKTIVTKVDLKLPVVDNTNVPAVVVGICAHGLAIVRALAKEGIPVIALENNRSLPGFYTRYANVIQVKDINGYGLIDSLQKTALDFNGAELPVLFLTNDNMVRIVGQYWHELENLYQMSWSNCRNRLLNLLDKDSLQIHCDLLNLPYPETQLLTGKENLDHLLGQGLSFPLIVKPTRPLSEFKVHLIENHVSLMSLACSYSNSLPFLLQQWIPGDDHRLLFTAFYLDRGRILAAFEGRKLASWPPALGQTTIAESHLNASVFELARRFFEPLQLSGPVSLEIKLDPSGHPWVIEPTLGRTDYWLDCCVSNGINLSFIEYCHQTGKAIATPSQGDAAIWFDTERSPLSYLNFVFNKKIIGRRHARFSYLDRSDLMPFFHALIRLCVSIGERAWCRLRRCWRR